MNFLEFTYTKADGTVSERAAIPLYGPTKFVEAIDVTSLSESDFADFCREFGAMKNDHHNQVMEKLAQYDLRHNYRKFNPDNMSNVTTEYV